MNYPGCSSCNTNQCCGNPTDPSNGCNGSNDSNLFEPAFLIQEAGAPAILTSGVTAILGSTGLLGQGTYGRILSTTNNITYNPDTGYFTVPISGIYLINIVVHFGENPNGSRSVIILKSSAITMISRPVAYETSKAVPISPTSQVPSETVVNCTAQINLDEGDSIYVILIQDSGMTLRTWYDTDLFSITRIA